MVGQVPGEKNEMFRDWDASGYSIFNIDFLLNGYKRDKFSIR